MSIEGEKEETIVEEVENEIPEEILNSIRNKTVVAATDAVMKGICIAAHWVLTTKTNDAEITGDMESTR